jgi:hypothetical protein
LIRANPGGRGGAAQGYGGEKFALFDIAFRSKKLFERLVPVVIRKIVIKTWVYFDIRKY